MVWLLPVPVPEENEFEICPVTEPNDGPEGAFVPPTLYPVAGPDDILIQSENLIPQNSSAREDCATSSVGQPSSQHPP
jgi:hypothetical protein